jgi:hypothetical protein
MNELLTKYYPGKFELVESEELASSYRKYSDTSIYKYAVLTSLRGYTHSTTTTVTNAHGTHSVSPSATSTTISYRFYDRTVGKEQYGGSAPSVWLKTAIEAFGNTVKKARNIN